MQDGIRHIRFKKITSGCLPGAVCVSTSAWTQCLFGCFAGCSCVLIFASAFFTPALTCSLLPSLSASLFPLLLIGWLSLISLLISCCVSLLSVILGYNSLCLVFYMLYYHPVCLVDSCMISGFLTLPFASWIIHLIVLVGFNLCLFGLFLWIYLFVFFWTFALFCTKVVLSSVFVFRFFNETFCYPLSWGDLIYIFMSKQNIFMSNIFCFWVWTSLGSLTVCYNVVSSSRHGAASGSPRSPPPPHPQVCECLGMTGSTQQPVTITHCMGEKSEGLDWCCHKTSWMYTVPLCPCQPPSILPSLHPTLPPPSILPCLPHNVPPSISIPPAPCTIHLNQGCKR